MENTNTSKVISILVILAILVGGYFLWQYKSSKKSDNDQSPSSSYEVKKPFTPPEINTEKAEQVDGILYFSTWQMKKDPSGVVTFTTPENVVVTYGGAGSSECVEKPDGYLYTSGSFETCLNSKRVAVSAGVGVGRTDLSAQVFAAFIQLNLAEHGK